MDRPCSDDSIHKGMTLVFRPSCIKNRYFNPIYWCGIKKTTEINPTCVGMEISLIKDSKNLSFVDFGVV